MNIMRLIPILIVLLSFGSQAQPVRKVSRINPEEVPAVVQQAFTNRFGQIPGDGDWFVNFTVLHEGVKTSARPVLYVFRKKHDGAKIEVRYTPEGRLEYARGIKPLIG